MLCESDCLELREWVDGMLSAGDSAEDILRLAAEYGYSADDIDYLEGILYDPGDSIYS